MLTEPQRRFYDTFGYVFLRGWFDAREMAQLREDFDRTMAQARGGADVGTDGQSLVEAIETTPALAWILEDERIVGVLEDLLGDDFIWAGSECNITCHEEHRWHADRFGPSETVYHRVKVMIYLDETRADRGCLRVLPGSHREPYHSTLGPLIEQTASVAQSTFGMPGHQLPAALVEANPGDVLFFCHTLWHGVYHSFPGRRFMALKYAERPRCEAHLESLDHYSRGVVFRPHPALLASDSPVLRRMVEDLVELGEHRTSTPRAGAH